MISARRIDACVGGVDALAAVKLRMNRADALLGLIATTLVCTTTGGLRHGCKCNMAA